MTRRLQYLAVLAVVVLLAAACGPDAEVEEPAPTPTEAPVGTEPPVEETLPAEEVTITYWHTMSEPETAQLEQVIAAFESANPGIKVSTIRYAYDDFKAALLTSLAGGEAPDTARLDIIWVPEFAELGALATLDVEMENFDEIASATFPGPVATNYWEGHYYGLPQNTNTQVLLWNREVFEAEGISEPPTTMEEFVQVVCALSDPDSERYGYALGGTYFWAPAPIFYSMGGRIVDDDVTTATGYVNSPESVAAFELLLDMYTDGCLSPSVLGGGIGTAEGHATGAYATIIDGPWMVDIYAGDFPDFEVNFVPVPLGPDGTTSSVVGGENVVVFADTPHMEAALLWAEFLLSEESQRLMAQVGVIPTLSGLAGDPAMPEYFDVFMQQLETAQARVPHPSWDDMDAAINEAFQRILLGEQTPEEALDQAADVINQLLQ